MVIEPAIKILFWIMAASVCYAYIGYPLLITFIALFVKKSKTTTNNYQPEVTLFVTAFNEEYFVNQKVSNSKQLNYPENKLKMVWVTDGSDDRTNELLSQFPETKVLYQPERNGKIHAMKRGINFVDSEIIIFTDANTLLAPDSIIEIVKLLSDSKIGCVAGEKRIIHNKNEGAAASGEGFYWKYESWIKKHDSLVGSTIGAAGELFAFRKQLYKPVADDTILDDFEISLRIALDGYKIGYAPRAFAIEKPSANVEEEMKRKVRIAAGSIQALLRLSELFNVFKHPVLSFQYISHKVFRWIMVPLALVALIPLNLILAVQVSFFLGSIYTLLLFAQFLFYFIVFIGYCLQNKKTNIPMIFIPYYFFIANLAMWKGFIRYCKKQQSVNWERAQRAK
jgi:cellulose synthase/poly-beta-1,6-N-acetylglucosamine synthase-like glycosyltransferase